MLAGKGRGGDTILAHITPKEVSLLKEAGGAGTVNPETGLLEFYDGFEIPESYSYGADYAASQYQPETYTAQMPEQTPMFDVTQYQAPGGYQAPTAAETPAYSAPAYTGGMFDYTIPETTAAAAPAAPAVVSPVGYPQGMMDIPVDTGAAPRAAIPMPGQRPSA